MRHEKLQQFILDEAAQKPDGIISRKEVYLTRYGADVEIEIISKDIMINRLKEERSRLKRRSSTAKELTRKIRVIYKERLKAKTKRKQRHRNIEIAFNQLLIRDLVRAQDRDKWLTIDDYLQIANSMGEETEILDLRKNKYGVTHDDYEIYDRDLIVAGGRIHMYLYSNCVKTKTVQTIMMKVKV